MRQQFKSKNCVPEADKEDCESQKFCDSKNGKNISMCPSYYVCHPQRNDKSYLTIENCLECGKAITVIAVSPYCGKTKPAGNYLHVMDDFGGVTSIGVLCNNCIDKLLDVGILGFAGGGEYFRNEQPNPDVYLEKNWNFKHPEFHFPEEDDNLDDEF